MAAGSIAHGAKRRQYGIIRWQKEPDTPRSGTLRQFIVPGLQFVRDLFDAHDPARTVLLNRPVLEGGAKIEAVVQIPGLDEDIRIDEIRRHPIIPASRPILLKVSVFLTPNIRNASR